MWGLLVMNVYKKKKVVEFLDDIENRQLVVWFVTLITYVIIFVLFHNTFVLLFSYFACYFIYSRLYNYMLNKFKQSLEKEYTNND